MQVICLEENAFFELVETVVKRLESKQENPLSKWVGTEECMNILNIKSKTTLQALRDNGEIRFTQPQTKIILYDRDSLYKYLEKHVKDTF